MKVSPRLKAVALLSVHDPEAAAQELGRAVRELGLSGAMAPAPSTSSATAATSPTPQKRNILSENARRLYGVHLGEGFAPSDYYHWAMTAQNSEPVTSPMIQGST